LCHRHDELLELNSRLWPPNSTDAAAVVLLGNQLSIPSKECVGCHDGADPEEALAPYPLGCQSQKASLGVGQSQPPATELPPENPVLDLKVFDDVLLAAVYPAGHRREQELKV
jgi:hypothetical protein